jgi:hypothetical protein
MGASWGLDAPWRELREGAAFVNARLLPKQQQHLPVATSASHKWRGRRTFCTDERCMTSAPHAPRHTDTHARALTPAQCARHR